MDFGETSSYLLSIRTLSALYGPALYGCCRAVQKKSGDPVRDLQVTKGGPILMVQAENEYGSYGNDRNYMKWLQICGGKRHDVPFYTADGLLPYA
jgi:hypothetical protein